MKAPGRNKPAKDITAHDQKLNRSEAAPGGDDYNQIVEMMLPNPGDTAQSQQIDPNTDPTP